MNENPIDYESVTNMAYKVASHFLHNEDTAKDIAQITAIECFMKEKEIEHESLSAWVYVVAKNKSIDYMRAEKLTGRIIDFEMEKQSEEYLEDETETNENLDELIKQTPDKVVPKKQKQFLMMVLQNQYDFEKLGKKLKKNKHTIRKKTYRIQQEILLYHKILRGAKRLQPIPGTKIHMNILNFTSRLKQHLEKKDMSLFSEFELDNPSLEVLTQIDIYKMINYQISIKDNQIYRLVIFFYDSKHQFRSVYLDINVIDNKLQIRSIPKTAAKIVKISLQDIPETLKPLLRHGDDGLPILPREELDKLLEANKGVVETIYSK